MRARYRLGIGICGLEPQRFLADATADYPLQTDKGATTDEQDVGGVHGGELLVRMLASALGRHIGHGTFQYFQQRLLRAFTGNVPRNGRVLVLTADLIDFVDVDDALLCAGDIAFGRLQLLEDDVLYILRSEEQTS